MDFLVGEVNIDEQSVGQAVAAESSCLRVDRTITDGIWSTELYGRSTPCPVKSKRKGKTDRIKEGRLVSLSTGYGCCGP